MRRRIVGRTNDHVLLAEFDSTEQAGQLGGAGWLNAFDEGGRDAEPLREALGKLRLEALLSRTIVLTDAQALDGRVILALAANGLLEWLRTDPDVPLPLLVRTRRPDLEGTRAAMFGPVGGDPFRSSFLTDGAGVARALADAGTGPSVGRGELTALVKAGASPDEVEALQSGWRHLDDLVARNALRTAPWDASRPWATMLELSDRYHPVSTLADELADHDDDRQAIVALGTEKVRSTFLARLEETGWKPERSQVLQTWFDERYRRAIAFQHRADYRSIHAGYSRRLYDERLEEDEQLRQRVRTIELPEDTLLQLGQLTRRQWQDRYARAELDLIRWWEVGDVRALDSALRLVVPDSSSGRHLLSRYSDEVSFGLTLAGDLATLVANPNLAGVLTTVLVSIGAHALGPRLVRRSRARIAVTDYLDDVEPKAP